MGPYVTGRPIGTYKGENICIDSLYLHPTYGGYIHLSRDSMERANRREVDERVGDTIKKLWGDREYLLLDKEKFDLKNPLPQETVFAWLSCRAPIGDSDGSHIFLVWFQDVGQDPFQLAIEKLTQIDWEKQARAFNF